MIYSLHTRWLWGDYGDTLINGHCERDETSGRYVIDRVGPFVPPLMLPSCGGDTAVLMPLATADVVRKLVPGISLEPVLVRKVVHLDWHRWDLDAEWMKVRPKGGEPENYVLEKPHSPTAASKMVTIVSLRLPAVNEVPTLSYNSDRPLKGPHGRKIYLPCYIAARKFSITGFGVGDGVLLCDERAKEQLAPIFAEWVRFSPVLRRRLGILRPV
jgi:hypothetical protein